ncbi:mechanosensitive ion channel [Nodosilinea sp. LEGE 07088]|uniref:mechanosensitive ion channel family protein n=1 Tax=Nodosilinea sp. LEGE 07088 TaxID=2777968 RepID=UPI00188160E6|nr:mechanosensitive ion channel domain-containing protein [Nodosilinea sp. LEGE 07088]MBE9138496.1 mechanosensitive ion channel [Nodosilinea sp. LEGE 07088]
MPAPLYILELLGDIGAPADISTPFSISAQIIAIAFALLATLGGGIFVMRRWLNALPDQIKAVTDNVLPDKAKSIYAQVVRPHQNWLGITLLLILGDLPLLVLQRQAVWLDALELIVGIAIAINMVLLGFSIFDRYFGVYMLDLAIRSKNKVNSEILLLYKYLTYGAIILVVFFAFAQAHQVNLIGLVASLGIGGVAIALAAQKILEQVLWSIMIYLDRPFTPDDYIHLNDGTFGRVESIGWRSTKIRLSGKSTLVIIPNSILAQMAIENLSGAQKVISLINVAFKRAIPDEERALIRQIILSSTKDIYGLDHRLTEVVFHDLAKDDSADDNQGAVQAQITFFILGSGEVSMELRGQLLEAARQNVMQQLKGYGLAFDIEETATNITSPMNI